MQSFIALIPAFLRAARSVADGLLRRACGCYLVSVPPERRLAADLAAADCLRSPAVAAVLAGETAGFAADEVVAGHLGAASDFRPRFAAGRPALPPRVRLHSVGCRFSRGRLCDGAFYRGIAPARPAIQRPALLPAFVRAPCGV